MISWVANKNINIENTNKKINDCIKNKHFTNNGKNVIKLQKHIKELFKLDESKEVLLTCNGAMGINALVGGLNTFYNKKLRWAVQSFTFPCSKQGLLTDSIVFDIDDNMGPNIFDLNKRKDDYDCILITNCFGASTNIELYEAFCKENNKLLFFDNAASPFTFYKGKNHLNYGNGCMVSLHHTKPIGFGEGGFIIFDKQFLDSMEKTICFGFTKFNRYNYELYASNYKMSEIACIYVTEYLTNLNNIYTHHTQIICYFIEKIQEYKLTEKIKLITNYSDYNKSLMCTIPILFDYNIDVSFFTENNIEAKKNYYPLDTSCEYSDKLFKNIICLPLNTDITIEIIDYYINIIINLTK